MYYLVISTITKVDHLTFEEAKREALTARAFGKRSELMTDEEARRRGFLNTPMQDLSVLECWEHLR